MSEAGLSVTGIVENVLAGLVVAAVGAVGAGIISARGDPVESITRALLALVPSVFIGFLLWSPQGLIPTMVLTLPAVVETVPFPTDNVWMGPFVAVFLVANSVVIVWHCVHSQSLLGGLSAQFQGAFISFGISFLALIVQMGLTLVVIATPSAVVLLSVVPVVHPLLILRLQWRIGERARTFSGDDDLNAWEVIQVYFVGRKFK